MKVKLENKDVIKALQPLLDEIQQYLFSKSQENITQKNIIDKETLLNSGEMKTLGELGRQIIYNVPYADTIEYGRLPGSMPPVEPIQEWVKRKLGIKDNNEANKIAWAIAKDLKLNGSKPRPFLRPAIELTKVKYGIK